MYFFYSSIILCTEEIARELELWKVWLALLARLKLCGIYWENLVCCCIMDDDGLMKG